MTGQLHVRYVYVWACSVSAMCAARYSAISIFGTQLSPGFPFRAGARSGTARGREAASRQPGSPWCVGSAAAWGRRRAKDAGDEALLALARQAAAEHQDQRGQPITRGALRDWAPLR